MAQAPTPEIEAALQSGDPVLEQQAARQVCFVFLSLACKQRDLT